MNAKGKALVTWASEDQDGDGPGIFAQRIQLLVAAGRTAAPMLSIAGLAGLAAALIGFGARAIRKRRS
jgi:hypothetical protein